MSVLKPSHTIRLVQPEISAVLVTRDNIQALAAELNGEMHASGDEFMAQLPSGRSHAFSIDDYIVQLPIGVWPVYGEDTGKLRLFDVAPIAGPEEAAAP